VSKEWQVRRNLGLAKVLGISSNNMFFICVDKWTSGDSYESAKELCGSRTLLLSGPRDLDQPVWKSLDGHEKIGSFESSLVKELTEFANKTENCAAETQASTVLVFDGWGTNKGSPFDEIEWDLSLSFQNTSVLFIQHGEVTFGELLREVSWKAIARQFCASILRVRKVKQTVLLNSYSDVPLALLFNTRIRDFLVVGNLRDLERLSSFEEVNQSSHTANQRDKQKLVIFGPGNIDWTNPEDYLSFMEVVVKATNQFKDYKRIHLKVKSHEVKIARKLNIWPGHVSLIDTSEFLKNRDSYNVAIAPDSSTTAFELILTEMNVVLYHWPFRFRRKSERILKRLGLPYLEELERGKVIKEDLPKFAMRARTSYKVSLVESVEKIRSKLQSNLSQRL